jgi:phosphate transport system substrate-binding protein
MRNFRRKPTHLALAAACVLSVTAAVEPAMGLVYGPREHDMKIDERVPSWIPQTWDIKKFDTLRLVGADTLEHIVVGWANLYRKSYPDLSVTVSLPGTHDGPPALMGRRTDPDSGHGGVGADIAPAGNEWRPSQVKAFKDKFGYEPLAIRITTGSMGSRMTLSTMVLVVHKDNPVKTLTFSQADAIFSTTRNRGHKVVKTWGDLGLTGAWRDRPVDIYGLEADNGISNFFDINVMRLGSWKPELQRLEGREENGQFIGSMKMIARAIAAKPTGIAYALIKDVQPHMRIVPVAVDDKGPFLTPTRENVYSHEYPLARYTYLYINRKPGTPIDPYIKEFLKMALSRQGQEIIAKEGIHMPLHPDIIKEELAKLE